MKFFTILVLLSSFAISQNWQDRYIELPDLQNCVEGSITEEEKQIVLDRVNEIRALHGLKPVTYDNSGDEQCQLGALISAANRALSHFPPEQWDCWTQEGYTGNETSNLFLGFGPSSFVSKSEDHVVGWLIDENAGDDNVGHRRSIINPFLQKIAFGRVDGPMDGNMNMIISASNLKYQEWVGGSVNEMTKDYVAYPEGNYPKDFFSKSYFLSFHLIKNKDFVFGNQNVDYSNTQITVVDENGNSMQIAEQAHDNVGWGSLPNCLRWRMPGMQDDIEYTVTLEGIRFNNQDVETIEYTFKLVDEVNAGFSLIEPQNNSTDVNPLVLFEWSELEGASTYDLEIMNEFDAVINSETQINDNFYELELDQGTLYKWKVKADLNGEIVESPTYSFTTGYFEPQISSLNLPNHEEMAETYYPELSWTNDGYFTSFDLELYASGIDSPIEFWSGLTVLNYKLSDAEIDPFLDNDFEWRVKTINGDRESEWSERFAFSIPDAPMAPDLLQPENESSYFSSEQGLVISNPREGYDYECEFANSDDFAIPNPTNLENVEDGVWTISIPTSQDPADTVYYWRVKELREGLESDWSEVWEFYLDLSSIEILSNEDLKIFPNPADNIISLESNEIILNYEIISMNGETVQYDLLFNNQINLSGLNQGSYLVKITFSGGRQGHKILLINR